MTKRLLEAKQVTAAYHTPDGREVRAVDNVSVFVNEGEILGCAGESGCGKSTLGNVLALTARPPLYPISGTLNIDGQVLELGQNNKVPRTWRGSVVSMLPQGALNSLSPTAKIRGLVVDVLKSHGTKLSKDECLDLARDRMKNLGLPTRALDSYPHQLSGGMKQRVITVISTLLNPRLLIADEPTSALDVSSQRALVEMLREMLNQDIMKGVIFITHDLPLLKTISDRVAIMYAGQIVEVANSEDIAERPRHPYSKALLNAVLAPEEDTLAKRVEGIKGSPPSLAKPPSGCRFHPRCGLAMDICTQVMPRAQGNELQFAKCHWSQQHPHEPIRIEDVLRRNDEIEAPVLIKKEA
ncbi:ABC transporter ATP-binding protein [Aestuariimicrobium kwangyangense]|uniref:ABC transporter ATP-binding protein n=1 Tax=Aestuariimicrobium kwangyangense TaxID=396389 RepID=UPI0003B6D2F4|nr:ABC transporter ATP-binding protein [Aestuariimicrobium kwangyangense]